MTDLAVPAKPDRAYCEEALSGMHRVRQTTWKISEASHMQITLLAAEWGCMETAVHSSRLSKIISDVLEGYRGWDEKLTIEVFPEEVEDFHQVYEEEFGEPYREPGKELNKRR